MAKASRTIAARPPALPPPPAPLWRAPVVWAAAAPALLALCVLQAYSFGVSVNSGSLVISFIALGLMVAQWAWLGNRGLALGVAPWRAALSGVGVVLLMLAVRGSGSTACLTMGTLGLHGAALICFYFAISASDGGDAGPSEPGMGNGVAWAWLLGGSAALGLLTVGVRWYANAVLKTSAPSDAVFMFFQPRGSGYEGIQGGRRRAWTNGPRWASISGWPWGVWPTWVCV